MVSNRLISLAIVALASAAFGQNDVPIFRAEATSAFVWGEDSAGSAISSTIRDPLTGIVIPKLSHAGIEVTSRMGFEGVGTGKAGAFLSYTATIVNGTASTISVRYGGIAVDGHPASPLSVVSANSNMSRKHPKSKVEAVQIAELHCFTSNFLSSENLFSANPSQRFAINPGNALTVSSVTRDPRNYSVRCSTEGCHPTGTVRYYVTVNNEDYVFVWPGRHVDYCGN